MTQETSKCYEMRRMRGDFENYLVGKGIDIGVNSDPLSVPSGSVVEWPEYNGDLQKLVGELDADYDFVYASHVLEHAYDVEDALKNWVRVLKPEGALYLVVPDYLLYEKLTFPSLFNRSHRHTFSRDYTREQIGRENHWHIEEDLIPTLKSLEVEVKEIHLEDTNYDYSARPTVDQTLNLQVMSQICVVGVK